MTIPFTKAHGVRNDFLLTPSRDAPAQNLPALARAICDRHTGAGADGWILVTPAAGAGSEHDAAIRLFNADGSEAEISGNGTRCAAAFLVDGGFGGTRIRILTGAGVKHLKLIERAGLRFTFEMNMGRVVCAPGNLRSSLALWSGRREVTILDVGNPQCAVFVDNFDFDWRAVGAGIERHPQFSNRTNVSFVHVIDPHTLEVRFWERGVGETMSSGTGSTGAAAAAILRGLAESPVRVETPAGPLDLSGGEEYHMVGPAEIVARGEYYPLENSLDGE